jgi:hypothetical protein
MIDIEKYMNDGANWQAQCVLAYLRATKNNAVDKTWNKEYKLYEAEVCVGRYENCREQGYIFSVRYDGKQRNYCVYEHRNSDELCVVVFDALTINTPTLDMVSDAMGDNKWNYTKAFPCGQIMECGDYILDNIRKWIDGLIENKED